MKETFLGVIITALIVSSVSAQSSAPPQNWYNTTQEADLDAEDEESGINTTYYCIDQSDSCNPEQEYNSGEIIDIDNETINYLRYFSEDKVGNDEDVRTRIFRIDLTDPETMTNYSGTYYGEPVTVNITCSDPPEYKNASGCDKKYLCKGSSCSLNTGTKATFEKEGTTVFRYKSMDIAGNNEPIDQQGVRLDFTPPRAVVETDPNSVGGRNATAVCSDELSGCDTDSPRLYVSVTSTQRCPTDPARYDDGPTYRVSQHLWVCAAAKDNVGNWGYSDQPVVITSEEGDPVSFDKDKIKVPLGGSSTTGFRIINLGTITETYEVTIEQDTRAGRFSEVKERTETFTVELEPGQSKRLDLEVSGIRANLDDEEDTVTVRTDDADGQNSLAQGSDKLEINVTDLSEATSGTDSNRNVPGIAAAQIIVLLAAASTVYFKYS